MNLEAKLNDLVLQHQNLEQRLADPGLFDDMAEFQKISRRHSELSEIVQKVHQLRQARQDQVGAAELLHDGDAEMAEMASQEYDAASERIAALELDIRTLLLPRDPNDEKNTYLEIRAGTGGEEAALFAADLLKMYGRYAESRNWKIELISQNQTGIGGYKEVVVRIIGQGVFSRMKYEGGVHRVQRVPETEASGRIHTSAVTVAIMPEVDEVEVTIRDEDLRVDTYHSSGHGGQSVNTTDSAVRITHFPTGLVVTCQDEKSQIKNRARAMQVLRARIYEAEQRKAAEQQSAARRGMVGSGDRSEKIRTYNYPENRLTDHRIGLRLYCLDRILEGDLDPVFDPLILHHQAELLKGETTA